MACFLVPVVEATVTTALTKIIEKKEQKTDINHVKTHFSDSLKRLNNLLWGGSALLAFEHLYHGEIQPFFPFLTAMESSESTAAMFVEMSSVGTTMAIAVTAAWCIVTFAGHMLKKKDITINVSATNKEAL